jgi:hypothetical protein
MSNIIPFPARRAQRVRGRLGLDGPSSRLGEIDEELRAVDRAIKTLERRKQGLLARYRAELRRVRQIQAKGVGA